MSIFGRLKYKNLYKLGIGLSFYFIYDRVYRPYLLNKSVKHVMNSTRQFYTKTIKTRYNFITTNYGIGFFVGPGLFLTSYHGIENFLSPDNTCSILSFENFNSCLIQYKPEYSVYKVEVDKSKEKYYLSLVKNEELNKINENTKANEDKRISTILLEDVSDDTVFIETCTRDFDKDESFKIVYIDPKCDLALLEFKDKSNQYIDPFHTSLTEKFFLWISNLLDKLEDRPPLFRKNFVNFLEVFLLDNLKLKTQVFTIGSSIPQNSSKFAAKKISYGHILKSKYIILEDKSYFVVASEIYTPCGYSGGPLSNRKGKLMGVNFCRDEDTNVAYAIHLDAVKKFLSDSQRYNILKS